jgi:hypothetical protein
VSPRDHSRPRLRQRACGRGCPRLLIQPSRLIASHLAALLLAGSGNLSATAAGYPEQVRQAAEGLKGAAELLEDIAPYCHADNPRRRKGQ